MRATAPGQKTAAGYMTIRNKSKQPERLVGRASREAPLHPRLFGEQHPESPVDDVVVVDHEQPQPRLRGRARGRHYGS